MQSPTISSEFESQQEAAGVDAKSALGPYDWPINFPGCAAPTLGVELELSLVDLQSRNVAPRAPEVLQAYGEQSNIKPELFRTIVEINTNVCRSVGEVRQDLQARLATLQAVCASLGLGIICTGSHPVADWRHVPITAEPRYQALVEHMAWPARRLLICGMHVHVGVKSGEHAIAIMNAMTVFLPHFLALSASSPYWHGIDTGMASCRSKVFEGLSTAGLPPTVTNWGEFVSLMRTFLVAGSIKSIREIWWDIRPHPTFGTVELRICDGVNTLNEICAIVAMVQSMVVYMQELYDHGEPLPSLRTWTLNENKWRAARFGEKASIIYNERGLQMSLQENILRWLTRLQKTAVQLGCQAELQDVQKILQHGPSYSRQRKIFDAGGSLIQVVDTLMTELAQDKPCTVV